MKNIQSKETVGILVIGGSGHGKSEFILSFINESDRKRIPASGGGQTTRTSMEYHINCEEKIPLKIEVKLKSKDEFIEERLAALDKNWKSKPDNEYAYDDLMESLIKDDAFFNIKEFGKEASEYMEDKYRNIFNKDFFEKVEEIESKEEKSYIVEKLIYNNIKAELKELSSKEEFLDEIDLDNETKTHNKILLSQCFQIYFSYLYTYCKKIIMDRYSKEDLKDLSNTSSQDVSSFLKTEDDKLSYSALVNTIIINTHIADCYYGLFDNIRIKEITFIDTYGLDHDGPGSEEIIKNRYQQLLTREYHNIKTVFYIRKINDTDAPADLQQNIPLLFRVAPTVVPYIIFTKIDKLDTEFINSKAYKEIDKSKNKIGKILLEQNVSKELIENRFNNLLENRIGYCSYIGKCDVGQNYNRYLSENKEGLGRIFSAIRYKKHLGSNLIAVHKLKLNLLTEVLNVNHIFIDAYNFNFYERYYPSRTKGALANKLQRGILGFKGTTTKSTYWSDLIGETINNRFNNIVNLYNWTEYFKSENILTTLSELFLIFADSIYKCSIDPNYNLLNHVNSGLCYDCTQKEKCIKEIIYNEKKKIITNKTSPVAKWLNEVYNFSGISDKSKIDIQDVINHVFESIFIEQCRQHNARVLALEVSDDSKQEDLDYRLEKYYDEFDCHLTNEGKIEFEQIINAYIQ